MSFRFILYTVPDCSECEDAKDLIKSQGMTFGECSLETQEAVDEFHRRYGHTTVPQVYLDTEEQEYIGGHIDLEKFILEALDSRRVQTLISPTGIAAGSNTVHVRQGKDGSTTISKEEGVREYNISITEKEEMKDITPK